MLCRENDGSANGNEAGEGLELQEVVERHYRPLRNFAISLVRCPARADDLTQETILIFVRRGSQIRQRECVRQWLFRAASRVPARGAPGWPHSAAGR
ncbi:MAG: sigma-70 family RNA polymerase sigma factor [Verrucomicrobia bacterium]|nr:sigma-70 family RNA polymerase sigma factor [Verrucomicrobiota bacterium]